MSFAIRAPRLAKPFVHQPAPVLEEDDDEVELKYLEALNESDAEDEILDPVFPPEVPSEPDVDLDESDEDEDESVEQRAKRKEKERKQKVKAKEQRARERLRRQREQKSELAKVQKLRTERVKAKALRAKERDRVRAEYEAYKLAKMAKGVNVMPAAVPNQVGGLSIRQRTSASACEDYL